MLTLLVSCIIHFDKIPDNPGPALQFSDLSPTGPVAQQTFTMREQSVVLWMDASHRKSLEGTLTTSHGWQTILDSWSRNAKEQDKLYDKLL